MIKMTNKEVRRRNARVPECMGRTEVARVLGVAPSNLRAVANLPEAVPWSRDLVRGELWRSDVIETFAAERRKRFGLEKPEVEKPDQAPV